MKAPHNIKKLVGSSLVTIFRFFRKVMIQNCQLISGGPVMIVLVVVVEKRWLS